MQITCELVERTHEANKQWWYDLKTQERLQRNFGELIALAHSEVSEAYEGLTDGSQDDKLPQYRQFDVELVDTLIRIFDLVAGYAWTAEYVQQLDGLLGKARHDDVEPVVVELCNIHFFLSAAVESHRKGRGSVAVSYCLANATHRLLLLCRKRDASLADVYEAKMKYNAQRHDHSVEARLATDGKKY